MYAISNYTNGSFPKVVRVNIRGIDLFIFHMHCDCAKLKLQIMVEDTNTETNLNPFFDKIKQNNKTIVFPVLLTGFVYSKKHEILLNS